MTLRDKLLQAAFAYDRQQSRSRFYNPHGLAIILERIDLVIADIDAGADPRKAIVAGFNDRLLTRMLKAAGLPDFTAEEMRGGPVCYSPAHNP